MTKRFLLAVFAAAIMVAVYSCPALAEAAFAPSGTTYAAGLVDGQAFAEANYRAPGFALAGSLSGFLFGIIGAGAVIVIAAVSNPQIDGQALLRIEGTTPEYQKGFVDGFKTVAKRKNLASAAISGGAGWFGSMVVLAAIYY